MVAEREGFEPSIGLSLYTLSRGALSAAQPSLQFQIKSASGSCPRPMSFHPWTGLIEPALPYMDVRVQFSFGVQFSVSEPAISMDAYCVSINLAEGVGFEPTVGFPTPVFKTGTFGQLCHPSKCAQSDAIQMRSNAIKRGVI